MMMMMTEICGGNGGVGLHGDESTRVQAHLHIAHQSIYLRLANNRGRLHLHTGHTQATGSPQVHRGMERHARWTQAKGGAPVYGGMGRPRAR